MNARTYPELGRENIKRCLAANGIQPDTVDVESDYDDRLSVGENIRLACARYGVETSRGLLAQISYWKNREKAIYGCDNGDTAPKGANN